MKKLNGTILVGRVARLTDTVRFIYAGMPSKNVFSIVFSEFLFSRTTGRCNLYYPNYPTHVDKPAGIGKVVMHLGVWDVTAIEVTPEHLTYEAVEARKE